MPQRVSQEQYTLSEEDNQAIFDGIIKVDLRPASVNPKNKTPFALFLGGQSGSGKSSLAQHVFGRLKPIQRDSTITINSDKLRENHPDFAVLQKTHPNQASFLVNPDTVKWQRKLIAFALSTTCNLILDGTLGGNPEPILETMRMLRGNGYRVQVCMLAVPARESRFGIYQRYEDQLSLKGIGRWVGLETHDRQYADIPETLTLLESEKAVDQIQLYARPTGVSAPPLLYDNLLTDGNWQNPPEAVVCLTERRHRPRTSEEQNAFSAATDKLAARMRQRGVSDEEITTFYRYVQ